MAFLDSTVVNIALPVMQRELHASVRHALWIVDAYLLVLSSLILAGGSVGDRLGRTRVFGVGVVLFALASLWCGAAPSMGQLIAARAVQGAGAALLVPGSLAILTVTFPRSERGRAIGTWSALTSLAIIAGPLLGGALVQAISWRAVFLINVPIGAVVMWIVWRHMPADERGSGSVDMIGTVLISLGLGCLTVAFIEKVWMALGVAAVSFVAFVFVELRVSDPIVPFFLFRSRAFSAANAITLLLYGALSMATFLLPFNLIQLQGYTSAQAGAAFLPFVGTMSLLSRVSGKLADRFGPRPLLIAGPLTAAAGLALLAVPGIGGSYWTTFFPAVLVLGVGVAFTVTPLTTAVMASVEDERYAGAASGINNAVARIAGLLAIAILGAASVAVFARDLEARLTEAHVSSEVHGQMLAQSDKLVEATVPEGADQHVVRAAVNLAFVRAFRVSALAAAALAALSAIGGAAIRRK